jgi:phosphonoacetate hydrolase
MPTVTNVNNTTTVTASFPEKHGITSNYFIAPRTGQEVYMESSEFLMARTVSRRVAEKGKKSVILTAKEKLENLIRDGASMAESAEKPPSWLVDKLGPPPEIYSIEINHWLFQAARDCWQQRIYTNYLTPTEI